MWTLTVITRSMMRTRRWRTRYRVAYSRSILRSR